MEKHCSRCLNTKPVTEFYRTKGGKLHSWCNLCRKEYRRGQYEDDRAKEEFRARNKEISRRFRERLRQEILEEYGRVCTCCGEATEQFLTLDHIHRDGAEEKRGLGWGGRRSSGTTFYAHVKKLGFPKDRYTLLCFNCNCGRERNNGVCPHNLRSNPCERTRPSGAAVLSTRDRA